MGGRRRKKIQILHGTIGYMAAYRQTRRHKSDGRFRLDAVCESCGHTHWCADPDPYRDGEVICARCPACGHQYARVEACFLVGRAGATRCV